MAACVGCIDVKEKQSMNVANSDHQDSMQKFSPSFVFC
jgi:hypothetical protein